MRSLELFILVAKEQCVQSALQQIVHMYIGYKKSSKNIATTTKAVEHSKLPEKTVSNTDIPFVLTEHLRDRLKEDYTTRFHIHDGAANLKPVPSSLCVQCGARDSWSSETYLSQEVFLVTPLCCYPAKGII